MSKQSAHSVPVVSIQTGNEGNAGLPDDFYDQSIAVNSLLTVE